MTNWTNFWINILVAAVNVNWLTIWIMMTPVETSPATRSRTAVRDRFSDHPLRGRIRKNASDPPTTVALTIGEIEEGTEQDLLEASSKTTYVLIVKFTARHAVQQVADLKSFQEVTSRIDYGFYGSW